MTDIKNKKGSISIDAQNIMPIIKKWLYSDKDIFVRELVANGCDAINKLKRIKPEATDDYRVVVTVDKENGTLEFEDNGIGMTDQEVEKYINQVAFSSAEEFLKNYVDKKDDSEKDAKTTDKGGIIGHFGLGFYSAFMVAKKVSILSKSFKEDTQAVKWESEDGMEFDMVPAEKEGNGTRIILEIADDEKEFLGSARVREVLDRYCSFMNIPVYLKDNDAIRDAQKKAEEKAKEDAKKAKEAAEKGEDAKDEKSEDAKEEDESKEEELPDPVLSNISRINETQPLWLKKPSDCTDEEYKEFYKKVFQTYEDPLFQVHLNVDYPFNLKGILYFPRIKRDFGNNEGQIKLFNSQVFVAENIKEVIPEYLMLLKGVIDCPDLPLNVSRSYLQNDGYVRKMNAYITRKVADKLVSLFNTDRKQYENYWDDISPFIKYGCVRDNKFFEIVKPAILFKTSKGDYVTIQEYISKNEGTTGKKVYYAGDHKRQAAAIDLYTKRDIDVVILDTLIDNNFISFMEYSGGIEELKFVRIDADIDGLAGEKEHSEEELKEQQETLQNLFRKALAKDDLTVHVRELADENLPCVMLQDEQGRRFAEMSRIYGQSFGMPEKVTMVLNANNVVVQTLLNRDAEDENTVMIAKQMYDLARMSTKPLEEDEITEFLKRSNNLLAMLIK